MPKRPKISPAGTVRLRSWTACRSTKDFRYVSKFESWVIVCSVPITRMRTRTAATIASFHSSIVSISLSSPGGEGRGEEALRFMIHNNFRYHSPPRNRPRSVHFRLRGRGRGRERPQDFNASIGSISLSSPGGEGRGEEAFRFMIHNNFRYHSPPRNRPRSVHFRFRGREDDLKILTQA